MIQYSLGSLRFQAMAISELESAISKEINSSESVQRNCFRLLNAYCVALADTNEDYNRLVSKEGINLIDGTPLSWVLSAKYRSAVKSTRGPDVFEKIIESGESNSFHHFFLGATDETLQRVLSRLKVRYPDAKAAYYSPPFATVEDTDIEGIVARIIQSNADLVWVGLGTPKQDFVASEINKRLNITTIAVGAAFNFYAGTVKEAPKALRNTGLEWVFRLFQEPRRLWKRYLFGNIKFILAVLKMWGRK